MKTVFNKFFNFGYTHHCYSHISETNHLHGQTVNIADKALCVSDTFRGIHETLLLFNKIKKKFKFWIHGHKETCCYHITFQ